MSELMNYTDELGAMLASIIRKDYTIVEKKCQELLDTALDEYKEYEEYLDEMFLEWENEKLQNLGLPF